VQSDDGVVLRLPLSVTIPAHGTAVVRVPTGPVTIPVRGQLSIPGLPVSLQSSIYGEIEPPADGGSRVATVVSLSDLNAAHEALQVELWRKASHQFVGQLAVDEFLLPLPLPRGEVSLVSDTPVGTQAERFAVTLRQALDGFAVPRQALTDAIIKEFGRLDYPLQSVSFQASNIDLEKKKISVTITTATQPVEK